MKNIILLQVLIIINDCEGEGEGAHSHPHPHPQASQVYAAFFLMQHTIFWTYIQLPYRSFHLFWNKIERFLFSYV